MADIAAGIKEQQRTEGREQCNHNQPSDFCGSVHAAVEQIQNHCHDKHHRSAVNMGEGISEPMKNAEQQKNMKDQQQNNQP